MNSPIDDPRHVQRLAEAVPLHRRSRSPYPSIGVLLGIVQLRDRSILTAIAGGHKQTDINMLLPWNYVRHV